MITDLIIPAHSSAKNCSTLGDQLLPGWVMNTAKDLQGNGAVRDVIVLSDITDVIDAAHEAEFVTVKEHESIAKIEQLAPVVAHVAKAAAQISDYSLILTPNVPFRDADKVGAFLEWAIALQADAAWTCEEIPCRPEMIVFDHEKKALVEQAIPGDHRSEDRRLVLTTHYAIAVRTAFLIKEERLRPPQTRLYQMPKGHVTWTLNKLSDLEWAERMIESEK